MSKKPEQLYCLRRGNELLESFHLDGVQYNGGGKPVAVTESTANQIVECFPDAGFEKITAQQAMALREAGK